MAFFYYVARIFLRGCLQGNVILNTSEGIEFEGRWDFPVPLSLGSRKLLLLCCRYYICKKAKFFNFYLLSIILILFTTSCMVSSPTAHQISHAPKKQIKRIVLVPFSSTAGEAREVTSEKKWFLTNALYNELIARLKTVSVFSLELSTEEFTKVKKENPELMYRDIALRVGKNLDAEAVLIGDIVEYRERQGGELGIESPASVAFDVELLNTENGERVWEYYFAETQRPLLENVAEFGKFIKRKGRWITADELAKEGIVEVVDSLNKFLVKDSAKN